MDDFEVEDDFIKLNKTISGEHLIKLMDDTGTNINTIETQESGRTDMLYDLRGRRISQPSQTGIYLKDGKKVIYN